MQLGAAHVSRDPLWFFNLINCLVNTAGKRVPRGNGVRRRLVHFQSRDPFFCQEARRSRTIKSIRWWRCSWRWWSPFHVAIVIIDMKYSGNLKMGAFLKNKTLSMESVLNEYWVKKVSSDYDSFPILLQRTFPFPFILVITLIMVMVTPTVTMMVTVYH